MTRMESNEIEVLKSGTSVRSDKNAVIDYDEDRVRSELIARGIECLPVLCIVCVGNIKETCE